VIQLNYQIKGGNIMRLIANIIWMIFGGIWTALAWLFLGILLCITIIGIPFGKQCFKAAKLTLAPFGKKVNTNFGKHPIANVIWVILCGWGMGVGYLFSGIACCVTIIGIPLGLQAFKMMQLAFLPFGATVN
jgi:uncharacterized membrane protein YccF (DUF307 family)